MGSGDKVGAKAPLPREMGAEQGPQHLSLREAHTHPLSVPGAPMSGIGGRSQQVMCPSSHWAVPSPRHPTMPKEWQPDLLTPPDAPHPLGFSNPLPGCKLSPFMNGIGSETGEKGHGGHGRWWRAGHCCGQWGFEPARHPRQLHRTHLRAGPHKTGGSCSIYPSTPFIRHWLEPLPGCRCPQASMAIGSLQAASQEPRVRWLVCRAAVRVQEVWGTCQQCPLCLQAGTSAGLR